MSSNPREPGGREGAIRVRAGSSGRREAVDSHRRAPAGFLRASEFLVLGVTVAAVLIAAAIADGFTAQEAWTLVTVLAGAYIVSRGLAKLGRHDDADEGL